MAAPAHPHGLSFNEKSDYEQRRISRLRKNHSSSSTSSVSSTHSEKSSHSCSSPPPRYSREIYSTLEEKPLPALPKGQRRVRFALQKPLPALPHEGRERMSSGSEGDDAGWALRRLQMGELNGGSDDFAIKKKGL